MCFPVFSVRFAPCWEQCFYQLSSCDVCKNSRSRSPDVKDKQLWRGCGQHVSSNVSSCEFQLYITSEHSWWNMGWDQGTSAALHTLMLKQPLNSKLIFISLILAAPVNRSGTSTAASSTEELSPARTYIIFWKRVMERHIGFFQETLKAWLVSALCDFSERVGSQRYIHVYFKIQVFNTWHR